MLNHFNIVRYIGIGVGLGANVRVRHALGKPSEPCKNWKAIRVAPDFSKYIRPAGYPASIKNGKVCGYFRIFIRLQQIFVKKNTYIFTPSTKSSFVRLSKKALRPDTG